MTTDDAQFLERVYKLSDNLRYDVATNQVTVYKSQNHWLQRLFRKLHVNIPEETKVTLDEYGSFVFQQIDGKKTVKEIGALLAQEQEEAAVHLYERLIIYLHHLETEENWIIPVVNPARQEYKSH